VPGPVTGLGLAAALALGSWDREAAGTFALGVNTRWGLGSCCFASFASWSVRRMSFPSPASRAYSTRKPTGPSDGNLKRPMRTEMFPPGVASGIFCAAFSFHASWGLVRDRASRSRWFATRRFALRGRPRLSRWGVARPYEPRSGPYGRRRAPRGSRFGPKVEGVERKEGDCRVLPSEPPSIRKRTSNSPISLPVLPDLVFLLPSGRAEFHLTPGRTPLSRGRTTRPLGLLSFLLSLETLRTPVRRAECCSRRGSHLRVRGEASRWNDDCH